MIARAEAPPGKPTPLDWLIVAPLLALGGILAVAWIVWTLATAGRG